ncbi:GIY-YIG nuclease family protein [Candidatus Woesebacteria bacterium]|nr:GIY-YIG nuclease family protein [Candidatus Woesebacteria bacterium]
MTQTKKSLQDTDSPASSKTKTSLLAWVSVLPSLPVEPGVYWFLDEAGKVLYVGKAKNLKRRVTSYSYLKKLRARTRQLVMTAVELKFKVLESELQALLVEAELIRTYLPHFNVALKDDKSALYIHISADQFPLVTTIRKKEILHSKLEGTNIGPFQSGYKALEVLQIARTIFCWCNNPAVLQKSEHKKPCFYYHINLCSGACIGAISAQEYQQNIDSLILFLRGKTSEVMTRLKTKMLQYAQEQKFELAAVLRNQQRLITEVTSSTYRLKPDLVTSVSLSRSEVDDELVYIRKILHTYQAVPADYAVDRIECYDVSNMQGQQAAVAMVTAIQAEMEPSEYRLFNIRTLDTPNDYHMMKEALVRRQNHPEWGMPNLVVIDGGKGQLRAALSVWQWSCPVISIAKDPDRIIIPALTWDIDQRRMVSSTTNLRYHELQLPEMHPALRLIQKARDEAHRFSKKQFTRRKLKKMFE